MCRAARERGKKTLAITDHSGSLGVAGGLKAEDLPKQRLEIDQVQSKLGDSIRLLQGSEVGESYQAVGLGLRYRPEAQLKTGDHSQGAFRPGQHPDGQKQQVPGEMDLLKIGGARCHTGAVDHEQPQALESEIPLHWGDPPLLRGAAHPYGPGTNDP